MKKCLSLFFCLLLATVIASAKGFTVVIDAGHGGKDPGAVSANGKVHEKDITLKVALMVGESIAKKYPEVKVLYTRKTDVFVGLNDRARMANKADADLFISIHVNAAENRSAKGAETYTLGVEEARTERNLEIAKRENGVILLEDNHEKTYANFNPNSPESYIIFEYMQSEFVKESIHIAQYVQENFANDANRLDRGVRQAGFLVLNATSMPSILVELGYISNAEEAKYLASASAQQRLSNCISKAFDKYYADLKKLSGSALPLEDVIAENTTSGNAGVEDATPANTTLANDEAKEADAGNAGNANIDNAASGSNVGSAAGSAAAGEAGNADGGKKTEVDVPVFKVQFLSSSRKLSAGDQAFKGLSPVAHYYDRGLYKYTYGASADYNEILRVKRKVNEKFKDAFIVAFVKGERINTQEAIALFHKNNP